jgi:hypothetical protein
LGYSYLAEHSVFDLSVVSAPTLYIAAVTITTEQLSTAAGSFGINFGDASYNMDYSDLK